MPMARLFTALAIAICAHDVSAFCNPRSPYASLPPIRSISSQSTSATSTSLLSLKPLLEEIDSQISAKKGDTPVVFVGGKGGVGKTSISSSLAVALASSVERDCKVLIVSTDPAHSLGDALDVDLRQRNANSKPQPLVLTDALTGGRLHALEVDPNAALEDFQNNLQLFDVSTLSQSLGINVSPQMLQDLGLDELHTLIRNPPPGLDELVALSNVLDPKFAEEYDVIIVDTAPTGHTLRMLALPQFLDGFLGTLLRLREKLKGLIQTVQMFMGAAAETSGNRMDVDKALGRLEEFQLRTSKLRERLKNAASTKFVVVTIPTVLSVRESQRLMNELGEQGVCVSDLVINQCIEGGDGSDVSDSMKIYYERRVSGQQRWINELKDACTDVSRSEEYKNNVEEGAAASDIVVKEVPYYDVELVGVPALGYIGSQTFADPSFQRLIGFEEEIGGPKVVICGGKGG
jgi:arsenite-transporting ATPase